ncbi:LapA family protein [bacterium]|nr:LapA family protein [bacterium]
MNRFKNIMIVLIIILCVIIVLQNMKPVETRILFFSISMPRIVLLLFMMAAGFVMGIIYSKRKQNDALSK